ncbi:MAG TPA: M20 family metallopeptidase [Pyrinomonadaceae bacterium]|nr:M20 family metallopeptidase [Pyrinomonadaceae bacterium]
MNPTAILEYFESRRAAILDSIRAVVDIESPSYDVERSKRVVDHLVEEARASGVELDIERIPADDFGDHLLIRAFPGAGKNVFLLGHTDTVHPVGTCEQNPTRIEDGKFFGCGIFDMKSGVVLMIEALRYFAETGEKPSRPISILLSCDEEVGSFTGRELVEQEARKAAACLVFEPSAQGRVKTGRKGTGMFSVHAHGIPAHAGLEPEKGANAILELSRQIEKLSSLNKPEVGTTVNVCTMRGGTTTNVIPEYAECSVDVRFTSSDEARRIDDAIHSLSPFDSRVSLEIKGAINRPPLERTPAVAELYEKVRTLGDSFGYEVGEAQVGGASDGNFVAALGVPVLDGLGIAGDGAHTLHEHILVDDIPKRATLLTLLLRSV